MGAEAPGGPSPLQSLGQHPVVVDNEDRGPARSRLGGSTPLGVHSQITRLSPNSDAARFLMTERRLHKDNCHLQRECCDNVDS